MGLHEPVGGNATTGADRQPCVARQFYVWADADTQDDEVAFDVCATGQVNTGGAATAAGRYSGDAVAQV